MSALFTEEHEMFRKTTREFVEREITPNAHQWETAGIFPARELFTKMGSVGLLGVTYDPEWGGGGADHLYSAILGEELGRMPCLGVAMAISVQTDMATPSLHRFGNDDLKERFLRPAITGEQVAAIAVTEPDAGSDVAGLRTRAVRDGDDWVLNGVKRWITNAGASEYYTVFAATDPSARSRGISAFVVEKSDEGFSVGELEKKLGIKGSPTRELYFDNVRIPGDRMIGDEGTGFKLALETLDHTRVTIAAQAVGIAQGALDYAAKYMQERKQFGKAIAEFQGLQFMLADMGMKLEAARQITYASAAKSERGDADLRFFGAAAKCFASDVAMEITTDAVQILGGYGYSKEYPVERMMRDAKITQIYEGTNQVQRIVMARHLLGQG